MDFDWNTTTHTKMHVLKKISVRQMVLILRSRLKDKEWEDRRRQAYS